MSNIFENLFPKKILSIVKCLNSIPNHQSGFCSHHLTIQQCFSDVDSISHALKSKNYCTPCLPRHRSSFPTGLAPRFVKQSKEHIVLILQSYLSNHSFEVRTVFLFTAHLTSDVPQGSILGPAPYFLHTVDIPTHLHTHISTYTDNTAMFSTSPDSNTASHNLQEHL